MLAPKLLYVAPSAAPRRLSWVERESALYVHKCNNLQRCALGTSRWILYSAHSHWMLCAEYWILDRRRRVAMALVVLVVWVCGYKFSFYGLFTVLLGRNNADIKLSV
ncbi:GM12977 [Drosophila sechellia]|uniref:GM12977 n=1 Tax=Drosophila sechellia TaxID=7238 RepID=B4IL21_DROSE|nr:GM12977 [Drosophila sechellia]